jgi:hypothetical protein
MDTIIFGVPQPPSSALTPYRSLVRITQPKVEPVSLSAAKSHCRVDTESDDIYIQGLISVARQYVEDILDITILTTTWQVRYDIFPVWEINLPRPMLQNKPITVTYRNGDGSTSSLTSAASEFQYDYNAIPGRIYPLWARAWPPTRGDENGVMVEFTAGYGDDGASVPPVAKHLILMLVGHWYDSRQPVASAAANPVPLTFETLLAASGLGIYR